MTQEELLARRIVQLQADVGSLRDDVRKLRKQQDVLHTIKQMLVCVIYISLISLMILIASYVGTLSRKAVIERRIVEQELIVKMRTAEIKQFQKEAERVRLEIENIRFEAFMQGYKNHEYVIEVVK